MNLSHGRILFLKLLQESRSSNHSPPSSILNLFSQIYFNGRRVRNIQWSYLLFYLPSPLILDSPSKMSCPPRKFCFKYHVVFVVRSLFFQPSLAFARVRNKFCFLSFYCCFSGPSLLWSSPSIVSFPRLHVYRNLFSFVSWIGSKMYICVVDRPRQINLNCSAFILFFLKSF